MVDRVLILKALATLSTAATIAACASYSNAAPQAGWQNWSPQQQSAWYSATQGSRLMPLAWMLALEQPDAAKPFLGPDTIAQWRLLPRPNSDRLPIGLVVDDSDDSNLANSKLRWFAGQGPKEKWVGMNCSACHTAELTYQGKAMRVDGGPALFDYQTFVEDLDAAVRATVNAPDGSEKWDRFAKAALGSKDAPGNRTLLRAALARLLAWEDRVEDMNKTPLRYGYGRVDAFGHIFNKVALFTGAASPTRNPADAPVSYPHIWDIHRFDKLQWNGIAQNQRLSLGGNRYLDYGALGRNAGEVIGVFGDITVTPGGGLGGYKSSVQADNLIRLETQLVSLKSPAWPANFGALDPAKVAAGKALFAADCEGCHKKDPGEFQKAAMIPLKPGPNATDPWMACNAITYKSATGNLQGTTKGYIGSGEKFGAEAPIAEMLETTVKGALIGKKGQIIGQTAKVFFGGGGAPRVVIEEAPDMRPLVLDACYKSGSPHMAYKARPLDGIWATAPFLHNGSVPTLYDLLLPAAQRPKAFMMGTREYDPVKVGYRTEATAPGNSFRFATQAADGFAIPGNGSEGHEYGVAKLTEAQRQALLEYLKSL
ncbi:MAG: hypothetical protein DCF31_06230 [Alphaproteobacteria bacterium]|nr:MAG: hypothetical protein DCF31_06230 [Alphaproteobacteria bacterium]